jgi:hypothetical protein
MSAVPFGVWRDLGYEGPLSQEQIVDELYKLGGYSPEGVAVEMTCAALRASEAERTAQLHRAEAVATQRGADLDAARASEARLRAALEEIAKGGTRPCDDEPYSARIAAAALAEKEKRDGV